MNVSRQFHDIVEPILYEEVIFVAENQSRDSYNGLRHLTRTIASRPELGYFVQGLHNFNLPIDIEDSDFASSDLSPEMVENDIQQETDEVRADLNILLNAAGRLGLRNGLILSSNLGQLIFLLHLLPRLRQFTGMRESNQISFLALSSLGAFAGGVPAGLQSISKLSVAFFDRVSFHIIG